MASEQAFKVGDRVRVKPEIMALLLPHYQELLDGGFGVVMRDDGHTDEKYHIEGANGRVWMRADELEPAEPAPADPQRIALQTAREALERRAEDIKAAQEWVARHDGIHNGALREEMGEAWYGSQEMQELDNVVYAEMGMCLPIVLNCLLEVRQALAQLAALEEQ